ncbi:hypothetical protein ACFWXD_20555 [[Kitasatospora] papulosa]|uniref:hypothetical protein n=1 Tax=[Kitasatospora] papulosa TaxID=1464011 RepID=UPI00368FCF93
MQAANELLSLQVTDPQAGFKPFTLTALAAAMPQVTDHRLSFDTDLLGAVQNTGNRVIEVDIAALHRTWTARSARPATTTPFSPKSTSRQYTTVSTPATGTFRPGTGSARPAR